MSVAVLGAYGAVGRRLVAEARTGGHTVTAAGRDADRLTRVEAGHLVRLSARDSDGVLALARTQDILVNATGIEDLDLAATATRGGAAFMDISAEGSYLERLGRLGSPRQPIVAGTGLAPGLTNLLAVTVPGDGPIHIGVVGGVGERHGDAARNWVWGGAGRAVTSGGTTEHVYRTARRFEVPGLGHRTLWRAGFGEQDQLRADLDRPVSTWLGLDPAWASPLLGLAGGVPRAAAYLDRLSDPFAKLFRSHTRWAVVVTDATATVAAPCLEPLRAAGPGVYAAHQLVRLDDLRTDLRRAGIEIGVDTTGMTTTDEYADFAVRDARGVSPTYERLALAVSRDHDLLALLDTLPPPKRQPNLLFGVVRLLGGPVDDPAAFHDYAVGQWAAVAGEMRTRSTQTNEAGRCAVLLPVLAALPQPLALLEVGAAAGLCLYPDRYAYRYGTHALGTGPPTLECAASGITPPERVPEVAWRAGLDRNPLDVTRPADLTWLDALVWPEHTRRRERLHAAAAVAAAEPPLLARGDLVDDLPALAAHAPAGATLVVFHTAVLYQVPPQRREAFAATVRDLPGHWLANEVPDVLPHAALPAPPDGALYNVLTLDGVPLAWTRPHGQAMTWFGPPPGR